MTAGNHARTETGISLQDAMLRYGRRTILRDLSLSVRGGEVLAILGPNGRGKTTLVKALVGSLALTAGTRRAAGTIGYVPQSVAPAFDYTVRDSVTMGRAGRIGLFSSPRRQDFAAADAALERLGLAALAARPLTTLSGGERQLVTVARALAGECRILILDEPASALDLKNQKRLFDTVRDLARRDGLAVAFTTHVPGHAFDAADSVLLLHGAAAFEAGPVADILNDASLSRLYDTPVRVVTDGAGPSRIAAAVAVGEAWPRGEAHPALAHTPENCSV